MKTYYFRQLKSGNFEIATEVDHTHSTTDLKAFFAQVGSRKSNVFSGYPYYELKPCRIIKAKYSQSQTYFRDAAELEKYLG